MGSWQTRKRCGAVACEPTAGTGRPCCCKAAPAAAAWSGRALPQARLPALLSRTTHRFLIAPPPHTHTAQTYGVRTPAGHPVHENFRVHAFRQVKGMCCLGLLDLCWLLVQTAVVCGPAGMCSVGGRQAARSGQAAAPGQRKPASPTQSQPQRHRLPAPFAGAGGASLWCGAAGGSGGADAAVTCQLLSLRPGVRWVGAGWCT